MPIAAALAARKHPMSVLLIAGSTSEPSRSAALLDAAHTRLQAHGLRVQRLSVHDVSADALLRADFSDPSILAAVRQVAQARANSSKIVPLPSPKPNHEHTRPCRCAAASAVHCAAA